MLTFRELTRCSWKVRITYVASSCVSVNVTLEKWKSYSIFLKYFIPNLKSKFKWMSWSIKYSFALTKKFFITEFDCKINKVVVVFHWKKVTQNEISIIYLILTEGADFFSAKFTGAGNSAYNRQFGLEIKPNFK